MPKKPSFRTMQAAVKRHFDNDLSYELTLATMLELAYDFTPVEQAVLIAPHLEVLIDQVVQTRVTAELKKRGFE